MDPKAPEGDVTHERTPLPPIEQNEWRGDFLRAGVAQAASEKHPDRNEDVVGIFGDVNAFALCDGMGGYEGGREAATLVSESIHQTLAGLEYDLDDHEAIELLPQSMISAFRKAQSVLLEQQSTGDKDTTATVVQVWRFSNGDAAAIIGHVGDCRAYMISELGEVKKLTEDDDLMSTRDGARIVVGDVSDDELERRKPEIRKELDTARTVAELSSEARTLFNWRNVTVGVGSNNMKVAVNVWRFPKGYRIALLSDGAYENLGLQSTDGLLSSVKGQTPVEQAVGIVLLAQHNGHTKPKDVITAKRDDISALILENSG